MSLSAMPCRRARSGCSSARASGTATFRVFTRRVSSLSVAQPEARAEVHPDLARRHGIADSDMVELRSRRGRAVLRARLSPGIRPDTIFVPFHWPGANALTNPALDPHSRMPAFKACAVALSLAPDLEGTT